MDKYIDLHLHLDGSLSVDTVRKLANRQGIFSLPPDSELKKLLTVDNSCRSLADYLEKFDFSLSLLQTDDAVKEATYLLCLELMKEGTIYAEIRFAPQLHQRNGLSQRQIVESAVKGFKKSQLRGGLILCCMRGANNSKDNIETVCIAEEFLHDGVMGIDLAGNEAAFPNEDFLGIFELANQKGIPYTIHAGEADGPNSVETAIKMGASRIGHGIRSVEDPRTLEILSELKIPLELCPTSNLNTAIFNDICDYPIRQLIQAGVTVTINSDNRTVSGTSVKQEINLLRENHLITAEDEKELINNAVYAAFCSEEEKELLLKLISE